MGEPVTDVKEQVAKAVSLKFLESLPLDPKRIVNEIMKSGETFLVWMGKVQGQITHRVQSYLNTFDAIRDPRFMRFYEEKVDIFTPESEDGVEYLTVKADLPREFRGNYLLTFNVVLSSSNTSSGIKVAIKNGDQDLLPCPLVLKTSSTDIVTPFTVRKKVTLDRYIHVRVMVTKIGTLFNRGAVDCRLGSLELIKID